MLTKQQQAELKTGFVVLREAFDQNVAQAAADAVWQYLEDNRGVGRNDPSTWHIEGPWLGLKTLRDSPAFQSLQSRKLEEAISGLLGDDNWARLEHWGGFLVSFPDRSPNDWTLPTSGWHVDFQLTHEVGVPFGIQTFHPWLVHMVSQNAGVGPRFVLHRNVHASLSW